MGQKEKGFLLMMGDGGSTPPHSAQWANRGVKDHLKTTHSQPEVFRPSSISLADSYQRAASQAGPLHNLYYAINTIILVH